MKHSIRLVVVLLFASAIVSGPVPALAAGQTYSASGTITVSSAETTAGFAAGSKFSGDATLNDTALQNALALGDVSIAADVDVRVESSISYSSNYDLTVTALRHVRFSSGADVAASAESDIEIVADSAEDSSGIIYIDEADLSTAGGSIVLDGNTFFQSSSSQTVASGGGDITIDGETLVANTDADGLDISSGGGNITVGILNSANSYEFVDKTGSAGSGSWDDARTEAKSSYVDGSTVGDSYLVTITSELENSIAALTAGYVGAWIGANRSPRGVGNGNWVWADGPERGVHFFTENAASGSPGGGNPVGAYYNNFASGEPNGGDVDSEEVGQFFGPEGLWNDLREETLYSVDGGTYDVLGFIRETNLAVSKVTIDPGAGTLTKGAVGESKSLNLYAPPDSPTGVTGSVSAKGGDVDLSWTNGLIWGEAISSFVVEASTDGGLTWSTLSDIDGNATDAAATISGLDSCTLYDFRVSAVTATWTSQPSSVATALSFGSSGLTDIAESTLVRGGDATVSSGVVTLTPDERNKKGAAWSPFRVDLSESFCVEAELKLSDAADTSGADGIAFVLQPTDTSSLSSGGGLGYLTDINPSVAVEFDTYPNGTPNDSDSGQDITLVTLDNSGTANFTGFDRANYNVTDDDYTLEDGNFHTTRVAYDANRDIFTVLVDLNADGDFADTGERSVNDVSADLAQFFTTQASTTLVYWGWTAATGGATNLQQVQNVKALPASTASNTSPTVTSPGAQTVDVGSSKNISMTIGDSGETTAAQWRLSVTSDNDEFATVSVSTASATEATVNVTGVADGDTTITLTAIDADGATANASFSLRVGEGSPVAPAPSGGGGSGGVSSPAPVVTPTPAVPRILTPPQPTPTPSILLGPVTSPGRGFDPSIGTRATVGGAPSTVTKRALPGGVSVQTGAFQFGMELKDPQSGGGVDTNTPSNSPEIRVPTGQSTQFTGGGLLPGSQLQVWLPGRTGGDARELARVPVKDDGTFDTELSFTALQSEIPVPIGRQVMQVAGFDENGNQTVVDMTINVSQGPVAPEPNKQVGALPELSVGSSLATSAGLPTPVTVVPLPEEKRVAIGDGSWNLLIDVDTENGVVGGTSEAPVIQVTQDSVASASGDGFLPGTTASVWMFSDPTLMGTVKVGEDGSFTTEFVVDSQFLPVGTHTLQIQGVGEDGFIKAANLGVDVQEPVDLTAGSATGLLWWVAYGLVAVLFLVVLFFAVRRRSRRSAN